jgi:MFS family permease
VSVPPIARIRLRARRVARTHLGIPREARYSLGWDILAGICAGAYMGALFPFLLRIARGELHASDLAISLLIAAPFVGNLLAPIWARQMEGRAKMPFCLASWIPARMLLLAMPWIGTAWSFTAILGSLQFIGTISSPAYASLMKDIYPDRARGRLMGYVRVAMQSAMFLSTLVAGRLLDHVISYQYVFPVAGLFGVATACAFSRVRPLIAPVSDPPRGLPFGAFVRDTFQILRDNVPYRWFALSVMTYGFGNLVAQPLYALYQVEALRITNTQIANLTNFGSIMAIVGAFFWGRRIDRIGAPRAVFLCILLVMGISAVYAFRPPMILLFLGAGLAGFGFAGIELSYMASILTYAEPGRAAQYQALHSLLLGIRGILAPLVGVPLARALGWQNVFLVTLVLMAVGAVMQWQAQRQRSER